MNTSISIAEWQTLTENAFANPGRIDTTDLHTAQKKANQCVIPIEFVEENFPVAPAIKNN